MTNTLRAVISLAREANPNTLMIAFNFGHTLTEDMAHQLKALIEEVGAPALAPTEWYDRVMSGGGLSLMVNPATTELEARQLAQNVADRLGYVAEIVVLPLADMTVRLRYSLSRAQPQVVVVRFPKMLSGFVMNLLLSVPVTFLVSQANLQGPAVANGVPVRIISCPRAWLIPPVLSPKMLEMLLQHWQLWLGFQWEVSEGDMLGEDAIDSGRADLLPLPDGQSWSQEWQDYAVLTRMGF
ncbi:MAG TPA: hypothetical protein VLI05_01055 [Candidatus Saccharimonadia bacterium]|nr:hypothetical protein [Candidatus Saccharimonadia bacterium]